MLSAILLGSALATFAIGWFFVSRGRRTRLRGGEFLRHSVAAQAVVLELREHYRSRPTPTDMPYFSPVVAFDTRQGRIEAEVMYGARPAPARVGATIEVRYDPDDPRRVTLATGLATPGAAGCSEVVLGSFFWILGAVLVLMWLLLVVILKVPA